MFEVGFSEMLFTAFIALAVLGPDKLLKAARFAGLWMRRARAQWYSVKAELEREIAAEQIKSDLQSGFAELRKDVTGVRDALQPKSEGDPPASPQPAEMVAKDDTSAP